MAVPIRLPVWGGRAALAWVALPRRDWAAVLNRVRLDGPFTNQALLALGWAETNADRPERALVPWLELQDRKLLDASVTPDAGFAAKVAELAKLLSERLRAMDAQMPLVKSTGRPVEMPDEIASPAVSNSNAP